MNKQANTVFWIGFILIALNFWLSGQSTVFWNLIAHPFGGGTGGSSSSGNTSPGSNNTKTNPGQSNAPGVTPIIPVGPLPLPIGPGIL